MVWFLLIFSSLLLLGVAFTKLLIAYSHKYHILDIANHRSSHTMATPRIGGLSFVVIICVGLSIASIYIAPKERGDILLGILVPCLLVACVAFIDDIKGLAQSHRFIMYLASGLLAATHIQLIYDSFFLLILAIVLSAISFTWLINLFNFMDGIDGIAASEAIFVLSALSYFSYTANHPLFAIGLLCCVAPIIGFLCINWPPASIFMGDVGSTFLGCLLGCAIITGINFNVITTSAAVILLGSFVIDASWTLSYRLLTGQKWYTAHRSHLYQILSRRFNSHQTVTLLYAAINVFWLLPLSFFAVKYTNYSLAIVIMAFLPLTIACFMIGAGNAKNN